MSTDCESAADALCRLADDVAKTGMPSLAWATRYVRDGDLRATIERLWRDCDSPLIMRLYVQACDGNARYFEVVHACTETKKAYWDWIMPEPAIGMAQRHARTVHIERLSIRAFVPVAPFLPCESVTKGS